MNQKPRPRWVLFAWGSVLFATGLIFAIRPQHVFSQAETVFDSLPGLQTAVGFASLGLLAAGFLMLTAALFLPARPSGDRWQEELALYRSIPALRAKRPNEAKVARLFARMPDDTLRVASILPSHSPAGRAAASEELARRNLPEDSRQALAVPGFFTPLQLPDMSRIVFGAGTRAREILAVLSALGFALALVMMAWNYFAAEGLQAKALGAGVSPMVVELFDGSPSVSQVPPELANFPEAYEIVLRNKVAYFAGGVWLLCWAAMRFAGWYRSHPLRVLLLRKFNDRRLGKTYKRLVREELQPLGHVIALADKHVQRPTSAWLMSQFIIATSSFAGVIWVILTFPVTLVLRMFDRTRWGPAFVASARDFRLLAHRLYDRMELNIETSVVARAYLVRTSDAWWKLVVELMMRSADIIILDVSKVTQGTAWEIETIERLQLWDRVVCIARDDSPVASALPEDVSSEVLQDFPTVFPYASYGRMIDRQKFREHLLGAVRASVEARFASQSETQA
jgi:hypothetical protein